MQAAFRVSMSTVSHKLNASKNYDHMNLASFAHYDANFLTFIMAAPLQTDIFISFSQNADQLRNISQRILRRPEIYMDTCEKASAAAPAPAATYQVLFLLHFLTIFFSSFLFIFYLRSFAVNGVKANAGASDAKHQSIHSSQHTIAVQLRTSMCFSLQFYFAFVLFGRI